jgi:hypothetical protein
MPLTTYVLVCQAAQWEMLRRHLAANNGANSKTWQRRKVASGVAREKPLAGNE